MGFILLLLDEHLQCNLLMHLILTCHLPTRLHLAKETSSSSGYLCS
jgi:hypothetical protein